MAGGLTEVQVVGIIAHYPDGSWSVIRIDAQRHPPVVEVVSLAH